MSVYQPLLFLVLLTSGVNAQYGKSPKDQGFELAPIATPALDSSSFVLVDDISCDTSVVMLVYELYTKNTMVFQTCVSEGNYRIFPFSGTHPTTEQIGTMAKSLACRAIFSSILLAGIPECEISNFPMRAAAETLLKIGVDIDKYPDTEGVVPSTMRFLQMMHWRRDVNLAQAFGLPCDSESQLYAEYSSNLYTVATNGLVRLTTDLLVEYRSTIDGSFSQEQITTLPNIPILRRSKIQTVTEIEQPCDTSASKGASSSSNDGVVGNHVESNADGQQHAKSAQAETEAFTSSATVTSDSALSIWNQARVAAFAAFIAVLVLA
ncbi:unnamed protein product [Phytophthora fragariaefolia]|uniref:Unnamed protein product n=1 Tax=Phytophthora fragariaefolia TaxID=1490495 RepID=A0A9W6XCV2_9STRA|nr:unnamed protein product [Phytophthora fragariaefolia]